MAAVKKVLIVDDDSTSLKIVSHVIRALGGVTECVDSAEAALQSHESDPSHVILSDIEMPGINGLDLLKTFKERWPDVPFIVFTGYENDELKKKAWGLGAFDFLTKPIDIDVLRDTIHFAIDVNSQGDGRSNPYISVDKVPGLTEITVEMLSVIGVSAFREVLESFISQSVRDVDVLKEAVDKMDGDAVRKIAHKLAGAATNLGMSEVEDYARKIESEDLRSWSVIQVYLDRLIKGIEDSVEQIEELIAKHEVKQS